MDEKSSQSQWESHTRDEGRALERQQSDAGPTQSQSVKPSESGCRQAPNPPRTSNDCAVRISRPVGPTHRGSLK